MMAMLSIPSYKTDDPNYRYKMPRVVAKVEGRGNGIKTNIMNMADIARALKRPPDYPTKFCGTELGAQSKFDPAEGKAIVNGAHEPRDLQLLIDKFIEKFVLCNTCNLPEIDLVVKKGRVQFNCNACGQKGDVDHSHKLTAFILKNPPKGGDSTMGNKKKAAKEASLRVKAGKAAAAIKIEDSDENEEVATNKKKKKSSKQVKSTKNISKTDSSEDDENVNDTTKPIVDIKNAEEKAQTTSHIINNNESSEDEITTSSLKKKSKKKNKNPRNGVTATVEVDVLKYQSEALNYIINSMFNFACTTNNTKDNVSFNKIKDEVTPEAFNEQLRLIQMAQSMDHVMKFYVALQVLFSEKLGGLTAQTLTERMKYLLPISSRTRHNCILTALQDFMYFNVSTPVIKEGYKAYSAILYSFYDNDLLSGEAISNFYTKGKQHANEKNFSFFNSRHSKGLEAFELCYEAAKPFLEWLDKEDDSDSENDEADKTTTAKRKSSVTTTTDKKVDTPQTKAFSAAEQSDSDIDIDAL